MRSVCIVALARSLARRILEYCGWAVLARALGLELAGCSSPHECAPCGVQRFSVGSRTWSLQGLDRRCSMVENLYCVCGLCTREDAVQCNLR